MGKPYMSAAAQAWEQRREMAKDKAIRAYCAVYGISPMRRGQGCCLNIDSDRPYCGAGPHDSCPLMEQK